MAKVPNPFDLFDELLEAKKAKTNVIDTSDDEDTVPMANITRKGAAKPTRFIPDVADDSEDEEEASDEGMDTDDDDDEKEMKATNKHQDSEDVDFRKSKFFHLHSC